MITARTLRLLLIISAALSCSPALAQFDRLSDIEKQIGGPLPISPFEFDAPLQGVVIAEQPTLKWSPDALSEVERSTLSDLIGRKDTLTPQELGTLESYIGRSLMLYDTTIPQTPIPSAPPVWGGISGLPRTTSPILTAGRLCPDGTALPAICQYSSTLPNCRCP